MALPAKATSLDVATHSIVVGGTARPGPGATRGLHVGVSELSHAGVGLLSKSSSSNGNGMRIKLALG